MPWGLGPGNALGRGSYDLQLVGYETMALQRVETSETMRLLRLLRLLLGILLGILLELLGILLGILPDVLGLYWDISNTIGETIGDIS